MADEVVHTEDERPRDTVVVERDGGGRNNLGLIILAVVVILLLIFFLLGNPFSSSRDTTPDVNVDVPAPTVNEPTVNPVE
jgi:hypothetical protein